MNLMLKARTLGKFFRRHRKDAIEKLINEVYSIKGSAQIIDLGGERKYWEIFDDAWLRARKVRIVLLNADTARIGPSDDYFEATSGDACNLSEYDDNKFDIVHSNSTIEHVGDWSRVRSFRARGAQACSKILRSDALLLLSDRAAFFNAFFHWFPEGVRAKMLTWNMLPHVGRSPDLGHAMRMLDVRLLDRSQMRYLFSDGRIRFEWFGPLPKSIIAVRGPIGA